MQNTFVHRGTLLLTLSASFGVTLFLNACGGGGSGGSGGGNQGGSGFVPGGFDAPEETIDTDAIVDAAEEAAALSEEELSAALAAADLDGEMALAEPSGLIRELGDEETARAAWAEVGAQMQTVADDYAAGTLFGTRALSAPKMPQFPGVRVQADGAGSVGEAFGAGWLGGSLFNAIFIQTAVTNYASGKTGIETGGSASGDVKATATLLDTAISLQANANFDLKGLKALIETQSRIPCPDANGLMTINSSLDVTGKAGKAFQHARFSFELTVEVDDDAQLTGKNQLKSRTETNTADSGNGYFSTSGSVDVSITEFADGHFGEAEGSYQGTTNDEAFRWMHAGLFSGLIYRDHLLPHLQKMLDAGRCVAITVEPSDGPMNLAPFTNVELLTKPRAKISNTSVTTHGTVQASFKVNTGGSILEQGEKVPADATFHYLSPLDFNQKETVTFEARSKRGTGKLDYALSTSPHAD